MNKVNNKKGISLIVLVITIIVMIILAAAIILSLQSSGIIGKANEAQSKTDIANKKEAAALLASEYQLAMSTGDNSIAGKDLKTYIKEGLENQGIDSSDVAVTEDGEILAGLSKIAVEFVEKGVKIGDVVNGYVLSESEEAKVVNTDGKENTADNTTSFETNTPHPATGITRQEETIEWRYFGMDEKGDALIAATVTANSPKISIGGKGGYLHGPSVLNSICDTMYSSDMGKARSIDIEDVTRILEYTGEEGAYFNQNSGGYTPTLTLKKIGELIKEGQPELVFKNTPDDDMAINDYYADYFQINKDIDEYNTERGNLIYSMSASTKYWLASSYVYPFFTNGEFVLFGVRIVDMTSVSYGGHFNSSGNAEYTTHAIRPVVALSDNVKIDSYASSTVAISLND